MFEAHQTLQQTHFITLNEVFAIWFLITIFLFDLFLFEKIAVYFCLYAVDVITFLLSFYDFQEANIDNEFKERYVRCVD